jgi:hypothetical protein
VGIGTSSPYAPNGKNLNLNDAGGTIARFTLSVSGAKSYSVNSTSDSALTVYDNTAGAERARIDSSGNLLVGTTTPSGDVATKGVRILANAKSIFTVDGDGSQNLVLANFNSVGSQTCIEFYRNSTVVGSIVKSAGATAYVTSSDYRLKENIAPMVGALEKVAQLKPCTYTWKETGGAGQGFIAHELGEVVPECVAGEKDAVDENGKPKYQGIDTSFLVATLTAAIQELKAIVDAQGAEIAALKGQA